MKFNVGDIIEYRETRGSIDFIDSAYIVLKGFKKTEGRQSPRLVIHPSYFDQIKIIEKVTLVDDLETVTN